MIDLVVDPDKQAVLYFRTTGPEAGTEWRILDTVETWVGVRRTLMKSHGIRLEEYGDDLMTLNLGRSVVLELDYHGLCEVLLRNTPQPVMED